LEYRRECGSSDIFELLCEPEEDEIELNKYVETKFV
jgi:hypothetical protein